ncbi:MlaD family protein [Castellaniella sp. GW247-6E4]|uniref:PqiB family protein n=1 Tax=Castellaniella sp. GW247-6E4 TaxID=3140380 RepID=UPI0033160D3F
MTEPGRDGEEPIRVERPVVRVGKGARWSWIWLVPLLAVLMGISLLVTHWLRTGPVITISFESADGLSAGQTKLRYKDVIVGQVSALRVADDRQHVQVDIQLEQEGSGYITQKASRFWVVRPQLSLTGVSGLGTLMSGVYISVDAPTKIEEGARTYQFTGLEKPPEVTSGRRGTRYVLRAHDLGSLDIGTGVYYRRILVGRVVGYEMSRDGSSVLIQFFVDAPYDRFVTADSRFWNISGIDVTLSPEGINMRVAGLSSVLAGGVAFAQADEVSSYDGVADKTPVAANYEFTLFPTRDDALADPDGPPLQVIMRFDQSVRGLRVGAPVDFRGMELGRVVDIDLEFDPGKRHFYTRVRADLYPLRFAEAYEALLKANKGKGGRELLQTLVRHGMRAQLRSAALVTGQQYVALDFFPKAKPPTEAAPDYGEAIGVPTMPGELNQLQQQVGSIVSKLDAVPIKEIGEGLDASLKSLNILLRQFDASLTPQATAALKSVQRSFDRIGQTLGPEAPLLGGLHSTLGELERAARALRTLADFLQAHPEALVRGHPTDALR